MESDETKYPQDTRHGLATLYIFLEIKHNEWKAGAVVYLEEFAPDLFDVQDTYVIEEDANPEEKDGETDDNLDEQDDTKYTDPEEK